MSRWPRRPFVIALHYLNGCGFSLLRDPRTLSEILAARNLEPPRPIVTLTSDKMAVRDFVARRVGTEYLVPLRQYLTDVDELDISALTAPCVIKATHGCEMTQLVRLGEEVDAEDVRRRVSKWLHTDFSKVWKEQSYSQVPRGVVIEDFIGDGTDAPCDYKFFCFHGRVEFIQISQNRFTDHRLLILDRQWRVLDVGGLFPRPDEMPPAPDNLEEMIAISEALAEAFDFVRIDLYNVGGRVFFGEITHYPGGGQINWEPPEFNAALGALLLDHTLLPDKFRATNAV